MGLEMEPPERRRSPLPGAASQRRSHRLAVAHPLGGCRLRLSRAKFHMTELDEHFRSYCRSAEMTYHSEVADTPWQLQVEGDPTHAVIVGETIQNIRTALDYLIYALVLHTQGRKPRKRTQFPISTTAGDLFRTRYQISELPGELRRRIRKLQPYQAKGQRSDTLSLIRDLSNADKHRLLIVTEADISGVRLRKGVTPAAASIGIVVPQYLAGSPYENELFRSDPNIAALMYFNLFIGETEPGQTFHSFEAFETLKRCLWTATEIIESFAPEFGV